jgi:sulfite exporter TauE/SafE
MGEVIAQPFLAGLSTGLFCCAYCFPFVAPFLVAEERTMRQTAWVLSNFILGRLAGYTLFGLAVGFLGERFDSRWLHLISVGALILLSVFLLLYALGLVSPAWPLCAGTSRARGRTPFLMGVFMGLKVCPPLLVSAAYVFSLHDMLKGVLYFLVFFVGTTIYFIPLALLGMLSGMDEFRRVARASAVLVSVIFLVYGVYMLWRGVSPLYMQ